jgi:hypothetical protein
MGFGAYAPFPQRLGETLSVTEMMVHSLKAALGDAFTQSDDSIVGAETLALARALTLVQWQGEKLKNNSLPGTSYDLLLDWAARLGVPFRDTDSIASIRAACAAKYMASAGASQTNINDTLTTLMAGSFIDVTYFYSGNLAIAPDETFWPKTPAPNNHGDLGLGDGTWSSSRCHILVSVQQASGQSFNDLMYLVNVQMYNLLDTMLPAWASFDFNIGEYTDGFILALDQHDTRGSLLGFNAF